MTKQKTYQRLQSENMDCAIAIAKLLKKDKCISEKTFKQTFNVVRGWRKECDGNFHLYETTVNFLKDHGIVTVQIINGLIIYVATQKCKCSKPENFFIEYQQVSNIDLDKAIVYQELNGGLVEPLMEGKVIAEKILGLVGKLAKEYAIEYEDMFIMHKEMKENGREEVKMKYAVLAPCRALPGIKKEKQ